MEQIQGFDLVDILVDLEEDDNVLYLTYVENKVCSTSFLLIQWSQKRKHLLEIDSRVFLRIPMFGFLEKEFS